MSSYHALVFIPSPQRLIDQSPEPSQFSFSKEDDFLLMPGEGEETSDYLGVRMGGEYLGSI